MNISPSTSLISQLHGNLLQLESALAPFRDYVTLLRDTLQACHLHQVHTCCTFPFLTSCIYTYLCAWFSNYIPCLVLHGWKLYQSNTPYYMSQEKVGEGVRALANLLSSIDSEVYNHNQFSSALVRDLVYTIY